ncbi:universal stress protein [Flavobacteriaceae bacterium XHP0103]|uniref:universal stress protein n=1 Tax=Marixanthotalea marina TaxID=2844359 RepID=UPI002989C271|nr:universal stress protein [Marixanthotalea marina]MBU3823061.1 universal stress protein [Marixanthotalea marina]
MKKIVCATDYSKNSVSALKYAYALSKKINAELIILNIIEYPTIWNSDVPKPTFSDFESGAYQAYQKLLSEFCTKHLGAHFSSQNVTLEVKSGDDVENEILNYANSVQASLLVLGVNGMSALKELLLGSTTKTLISKSNIPVVAVPDGSKLEAFENLVYATTLADEDIMAIKKICDVFGSIVAKLEVVHVSEKQDDVSMSKIEAFRTKLNSQFPTSNIELKIIYDDDVFETLKNYLKEQDVNILGMLEREKRVVWKNLFHRDLVKRLEDSANIPLISINQESVLS